MTHFLLRLRTDLYERVRLVAKQSNLSINKMIIELIEIGFISYLKDSYNKN